jgi:poly-gamma-glutamate capsule biosynthesis protein CapA/YwtB (metallophosphatase superfamily)
MLKRIVLPVSLLLVVGLALFFSFSPGTKVLPDISPTKNDAPGNIVENSPPAPGDNSRGPTRKRMVLAAAGDIMVHSPQFMGAYLPEKDCYDFDANFTYIAPYLQKADFAVTNLETTLAGKEYGYSGYPLFNSPPEIASALKKSGFDLLFTANNHSLDRGKAGILNTIQHIEEAGLNFVGTARSQEERDGGYLLFQKDLRIAFFAYTYGTNGLPIPDKEEYLLNLIAEDKMREDIGRAKNEMQADFIVFGIHWGNEYQRLPTSQQRELARELIGEGVDLIIGNHSHVVQPAEYIETDNNEGLVLYSLGNFISNQRPRYCDSGSIVFIQIEKDLFTSGQHVSLLEIIPTWVYKYADQGRWKYRILPIKAPTDVENYQEIFNLNTRDLKRLAEVPSEIGDIMQYYREEAGP